MCTVCQIDRMVLAGVATTGESLKKVHIWLLFILEGHMII